MTVTIGRRELLVALGGAAAAWPLAAYAQQPDRMRRIAVLMGIANELEGQKRVTAFRQGLQAAGWAEGLNVRIDYHWVGGDADRARAYAVEVIGITPDVILANGTTVVAALQHEARSIPVVFVLGLDPVESGFVAGLAHPGGNITGFTTFEPEMGGKWLEVLKEIAPRILRVGLIFNPATQPAFATFLRSIEAAAPSFGVKPIPTPVHSVIEIEDAMAALGRESGGSFIVLPDVFTSTNVDPIVASAARHGLPALYPFPFFARQGGLVSYGIDLTDLFRRSASYVDRILRGTKPGELPVQTPNKFELVINSQTAKALGLEVPPTLLARADEVIE
jgi:putative tryptophan/tyrosine transport system substrate-binding protein